ncbi:heparinase II/III-family protein [Neobacillus mesonae]|nr:heparinase II/III-family protein [Neobacillus mesonae]
MNQMESLGKGLGYIDTSTIKEALIEGRKTAFLPLGTAVWQERLCATRGKPEFSSYWQQIEGTARRALQEPLPPLTFKIFRHFADSGARKDYEDVYFERRARLAALGLITAAAGVGAEQAGYLSALEDALWDICGEYSWCLTAHLPAEGDPSLEVDLFAAETAETLAELLYMYEDALDCRVAKRVRDEVFRRVLHPVFIDRKPFFWRNVDHNWSAVCAGGSGMAALLLMDDEEELASAIKQVLASFASFLDGYGMDGGCAEGLGYWVYGFGYYTYFAEMLRERTNGRLDLLVPPQPRIIASFPSRVHLSGGVYVNFSDSEEREVLPSGLLSRLAERTRLSGNLPYHIPGLLDDPVHRWAHVLRNALWSKEELFNKGKGTSVTTQNSYFEELEWWVSRGQLSGSASDEAEEKVCGFALKGGHNGEPHNHNDLGQFIVHGGGENIICDLGAGMYTKAYFREGREGIINISSGGHNVPVINGVMQGIGREYYAETRAFRHSENGFAAELDLTKAYPEAGIDRYTRSAEWVLNPELDRAALELTDRFVWSGEGQQFEERLISRIKPIEGNGAVHWMGKQVGLKLVYNPEQLELSIGSTEHLDHDGHPFTFYTTRLIQKSREVEPETVCRLRFEMENHSK